MMKRKIMTETEERRFIKKVIDEAEFILNDVGEDFVESVNAVNLTYKKRHFEDIVRLIDKINSSTNTIQFFVKNSDLMEIRISKKS